MYKKLGIWILAVTGIVSALTAESVVSAHGGTSPLIDNERVGPYKVQVGTLPGRPYVGNVHLSILLKDAEGEKYVTTANIMVTATSPEGAISAGPTKAINTSLSPQVYDLDIFLGTEGVWNLTVEINSLLGEASLEVPLKVAGPNVRVLYLNAALFGLSAAMVALTLTVWVRRSIRTGRERQKQLRQNSF